VGQKPKLKAMKTTITALAIILFLFVVGCSKGERDDSRYYPMKATDIVANYSIDNIADDLSDIAQIESEAVSTAGRGSQPGLLGECTQTTTTISGNTWTRIIDFGTSDCSLANGNKVRGKIILTFSDDFPAAVRTVRYRLENFYHNSRFVQGNDSLGKTFVNGHPTAALNLSMTVTTPTGFVLQRMGRRLREFTSGYNTLAWSDDQFSVTGSWSTSFPNRTVHFSTVNSPLIIKSDCEHILGGTIKFTRDNASAAGLLDYGNGTCDNQATLYVNGNPSVISL